MRTIVFSTLIFSGTLLSPVALADDAAPAADPTMAEARRHYDAGRKAFDANDLIGAIREFKAAAALRPAPRLDYNIALANDRLGRWRVALRYYRRYLDGAPAATDRVEVETRIAQLEQQINAQP
jgi:hypothetical protein